MGMKEQHSSGYKRVLPWTIFSVIPIALFSFYFYPLQSFPSLTEQDHIIIEYPSPSFPSSPKFHQVEENASSGKKPSCDYTNGKWVHDKKGPLYNGTTCGTIKEGQNCIGHGRPDFDYLYWKWRPSQCEIPRFDPSKFLQLLSNKHLAFVGDSMARNQLESLLCMLAISSNPNLVYRDSEANKFRRWHFDSHNVIISVYWSPFLVKGIEKSPSAGLNHNKLYLDSVDERWAKDLGDIDMIVLSIGHWFLHPAIYMESGSVLGCHSCEGVNHAEIGFYEVFRKAIRTTLKAIIERKGDGNGKPFDTILTTFSPSHFEGRPWDSLDACNYTKPYKEKNLEGMDLEMRKVEMEELEAARSLADKIEGLRIEALDVTKLSLLRRDGHPGPYMYPIPYANGVPERLPSDCVHWCMPGPVDTWNEIMLEVMKRWRA